MAFIDNRDLKVHIRHVHENYRPFECEACHQAYKTKQGLTTHQKAHPEGDCVDIKKITKDADDDTTEQPLSSANLTFLETPDLLLFECRKRVRFVSESFSASENIIGLVWTSTFDL